MVQTQYDYKILTERENTTLESKIKMLGQQGWRLVHFSVDDKSHVRAVMELSKPTNESAKG